MNTPIPEGELVSIREALYRGRKIEAIKIYREVTGMGLAEAKAAVERLEEELRATRPENFLPQTERRGCLGLLVVGFGVGVIVLLMVAAKLN